MSPKYPRLFHLPWSPGGTKDDRRLASVDSLLNQAVVLSEKMDGSNVCLEAQNVFARSHEGSPRHSSFDALKAIHSGIKHLIPEGVQVFGEWCYAKHSIAYDKLPSYLLVFGVRYLPPLSTHPLVKEMAGNDWLQWDEVQAWAAELGVSTVPELDHGRFATEKQLRKHVEALCALPSACGVEREGVVVRLARSFSNEEFETALGKWVRAGHVKTDIHWSS
jgi:hypothetical protein